MGIRQIQLRRTIEKVIRHYLIHGKYPTLQTITYQVSQWLREHTPGAPSFTPFKVIRRGKSSAERYNENIQAIHQDLTDAYQATIDHTQRIMTDFQYGETERKKLWHDLSQISRQIDQLLLIADNASGYVDSIILSFADASQVNQAESSILVNLTKKQITLKENDRKSTKIPLFQSQARFQMLTNGLKHEALQTIDHAFDEDMNSAWWQVVQSKTPGVMRAELTILFEKEESINEIEYVAHHVKPVMTKIEYTMDGTSFLNLPADNNHRKVIDSSVWSFQEVKAKGIKFVYEKKDHDDRSSDFYQYYFGAKHIGVYRKSYVNEGVFYSKPMEIGIDNVNLLSIFSKHEVPYNTSLEYEVALYEPNKMLADHMWYPISSSNDSNPKHPKSVEFNVRTEKAVNLNKCEWSQQRINGMKVFSLLKGDLSGILPDVAIHMQNPKLLRGIRQWRRERTHIPFDGTIPLNSKWEDAYTQRPYSVRNDYQNIGNILNLRRGHTGKQDNFYRFTTCIHTDEPRVLPLTIPVYQIIAASQTRKRMGSYAVYLNKERILAYNEELTLKLKPGWNEFQILLHYGDLDHRADLPEEQLPSDCHLGKLNFSQEKYIRADYEPLQFVEVHSLFHNIAPNNHNYFAIQEQQVVLNYLAENCNFELHYELEDAEEKNNQFVLRAFLKRNSDVNSITPKIHQIEIRAK